MFKKAVTLIEIIISTAIFAVMMIGLVSLFTGTKHKDVHSRQRIVGGRLGASFLDPLQLDVRYDQWDVVGGDYIAPNQLQLRTDDSGGLLLGYTPSYTVEAVPGYPATGPLDSDPRKVVLRIIWTEAAP